MKKELRKLKLFELGIGEWPYTTSYESMKDVVDRNLDGCVIKTSDDCPDSYVFIQGGKYIMEQDKKNDALWVRWDGLWSIFSNDFSLEHSDIQAIIKFLVEQHLKSKVGTPKYDYPNSTSEVEQHLKSKVGTPGLHINYTIEGVEKHLKSKVGTPQESTWYN